MSSSRGTTTRKVLVVTGARSEFGLLRPVMDAIRKRKTLELLVVVAGEHLLRPASTWREVAAEFRIDAKVPMQRLGEQTRLQHAAACARGMEGFAAAFKKLRPDWVVVLGDRIEAFAAASAASIGGIAVCHIHGGDRAEGIADEAMRHAISKLAHMHCVASVGSQRRLERMGESGRVFLTGSPAIDGLRRVRAMGDEEARALGDPRTVVLQHPAGFTPFGEEMHALETCWLVHSRPGNALFLSPNHDPNRDQIVHTFRSLARPGVDHFAHHLPRPTFLSLLKRIARLPGGSLIGNSSAGLIECAALGVPVVNLGPRQKGRERSSNVLTWAEDFRVFPVDWEFDEVCRMVDRHIRRAGARPTPNPFGDGQAGVRIAQLLARHEPCVWDVVRKRNSY